MSKIQDTPEVNDQILSAEKQGISPPEHILKKAFISEEKYNEWYKQSIGEPNTFWGDRASEELEWFKKWDTVLEWNGKSAYTWFAGGKINISHNCLDRHVNAGRGNKTAYIWTNEEGVEIKITYLELLDKVMRFASGLKKQGLQKGDRVSIYMPLTIEQIIAMLACARIGAIHSVIYAGFTASSLRVRTEVSQAKMLITTTFTRRRGKNIPLKPIVDEAVSGLEFLQTIIVDPRGESFIPGEKEIAFQSILDSGDPICEAEWMDSEDPLFILYTSGTTGLPKGVVHVHGGYNLFTHLSTKLTFDLHEDDLFWCTADTGWITGHSYNVYGPLSAGASSLIFEGAPDFPDPGIWWKTIEKYKVSVFYTAPTAVRLFMKHGNQWPEKYDLSSLRILGSVGEPINPEAWNWYYTYIGKKNVAVVDTWWQTETGGHMILSLPACKQKPGWAGKPFFGVKARVVDKQGNYLPPDSVGHLIIESPWPAALRTCYGQPERFEKYWNEIGNNYYAGDLATYDHEGFFMILGRADDVLKVSGHRIGTAEVESAIVSHPAVAEAAVVGIPHELKGESISAFVLLITGNEPSDSLNDSIKAQVKKEIGSLAVPDEITFMNQLPKTRSGKIMRRVLKARAMGVDPGDVSTLEE